LTIIRLCNNIVITMPLQTIFKAGNSHVVTIPTELMQQLDLRAGEKVSVEKAPLGNAMVIKKSTNKIMFTDELNAWFKVFIKENGEILDELAVR